MSNNSSIYVLNNQSEIPAIGFGTWQTPDGETAINSVKVAIKAGYTHIDTAAVYGNEVSVGQGIKESGVDRASLFITSKVWNNERGYESTLAAFEKTISDLQTDYLDLYLIHWPANEKQFPDTWQQINADTWRAMEELQAAGKIKSIGLSNFLQHHIDPILKTAKVAPAVNQIEFHPGFMQAEVVDYCKSKNILIEAWSPLGTGKVLDNETLKAIATKYNKSVAHVCIKWCLQHETLPLPKSITPERIKQNLEVYDFELSAEDIATIDALPYIGGSGLHPDEVDF